ncbi:uncharacterized protein RHIMIDRAFT_301831 [Rhizopus microsporus ATCC 52813]|uniref:Uncharacterized protein n=2 Tax=Rhizopus microsporus TaxID=58291 RepID=A0A2G4SJ72_RHIZD|nr:uncharacterized protein RHIMIDRAFT_301831 [Rhizopus microsporus ATCC 52813]PHZ08446.1 hypothetical protein RHIMIDRAFT_301831 [Rhizopus microsporus ATCC 52813]
MRGSYRNYTPEQIEKLFDLVIEENYTAKDATLVTGINVCTAQNYIKTYNNDIQRRLPGTYDKPRERPHSELTNEYSKFLLDHIEKNPTATLDELKVMVCEEFEGLKIPILAIYRHLVSNCHFILKKSKKLQQQEILIE